MDSISSYKNRALASLKGNWEKGILATFLYFIGTGGLSFVPTLFVNGDEAQFTSSILSIVFLILILPFEWGMVVYFLAIARGEDNNIGKLLDGYNAFKKVAFTKLLVKIFTFLWTLLLIIPGIVKFYSYSMTDYILRDEADLAYDAAIERSMAMMKGHKMDLFLLHLSFIGWAILCVCTFGFGFLFLIPYVYTAQAHFYEDLKAEFQSA